MQQFWSSSSNQSIVLLKHLIINCIYNVVTVPLEHPVLQRQTLSLWIHLIPSTELAKESWDENPYLNTTPSHNPTEKSTEVDKDEDGIVIIYCEETDPYSQDDNGDNLNSPFKDSSSLVVQLLWKAGIKWPR